MTRIYKGGGADRRYQASTRDRKYSPTQASNNTQKIQQQGQRVLDDLDTLRRERERLDATSNLEQSLSDKAAELTLRQEQLAESGQFKLTQLKESFLLSNEQLTEKQRLQTQQAFDKATFQLEQLGDSQKLKREQFNENQALAAKDREERFDLGLSARGQSAQFAVDNAHLQASQTVEQANARVMMTAISSLVNFGLNAYQHHANQQEKLAKQQTELDALSWLFSPEGNAVTPSGEINQVVTTQRAQQQIEIAEEQAIQKVAGGNTIEAENIRQPNADATMYRNLRQASVGDAALNFQPEFERFISDPSTVINGRTLASINNRPELWEYLKGAAVELTKQFGVSGKEAHAMVVQYGTAVRGSVNAAYQNLGAQVAAAAKQERYDAGLHNATNLMQGDNHQIAWEVARSSYETSGLADGLSHRQINDAVFEDLVRRADNPNDLLDVLKNGKGTEFRKQRVYSDMVQKEINRRADLDDASFQVQQTIVNNQIKEISLNTTELLMKTADPAESYQIRQDAIAQLSELGPLAYDEINRLAGKGKNNMNVYRSLLNGFYTGDPPSTDDITEQYLSEAITTEQKETLMNMGLRADQIYQTIERVGLPTVEKQLEAAVMLGLTSHELGIDATERKGIAAGIVANMLPEVEAQVKMFVLNNPEANNAEIQKGVADIMQNASLKIFDTKNGGKGLVYQETGTKRVFYKYDTSKVAPVILNPVTGKAQRVYIEHSAQDIPDGAKVDDIYLSEAQLLKAVEVWNSGRQTYSARIKELSSKLGVSPTLFVRKQAIAGGYPSIEEIKLLPAQQAAEMNYKIDPELQSTLDVIGKYESDSVGGYEAINQIGINGGYGVLGYSGDIRNMPQHGGKALTSMSIAEIMDLQAPTTQSNESWIEEGRLHAVGRYQFIGPTLASIVNKTGIDVNEKFTPEVQDYLAGYLLADASNGIEQWMGPKAYATPEERAVVENSRRRLQEAYRILRSPMSTQTQISRAKKTVGNPFYA